MGTRSADTIVSMSPARRRSARERWAREIEVKRGRGLARGRRELGLYELEVGENVGGL